MDDAQRLRAALADWVDALGNGGVAHDASTLGRYARTTQDKGTRPCCVLYPGSTEEVQQALRVAARHGVVVYPVSRGRNWGYGDACAPLDGAAILDLSRMDRILEVNEDLAYAVVEAGVSQQQLCEYLRARHPGLWLDCTGAGGGASLAGNVLDRGFGHTPYGDHFLSACGMQVVLADGRLLDTGFTHYGNARAARAYRYGVGPFLDGLFCQSNLGVVTRLGLWLMPAPEAFAFFFVRLDRYEDLPALVDRLRPLRLDGTIRSALHIGNDLRLLSGIMRYPFARAGGRVPMPAGLRAELRREHGLGAWNAGGSLTGTRGQVRASKQLLRRAVRGLGKLVFVGDAKLALGRRAARILGRFGLGAKLHRQLASLEPNYGLLKGIPTDAPMLGAEWRLRSDEPLEPRNPLEACCGLMWISPVLPARGEDAARLLEIVTPLFAEHGFDPLVTMTMINERAMIAIMNVAFDPSVPGETESGVACYDALFDAVLDAGYVPYRTGPRGMPKLRASGDAFWDVAVSLKRALDPGDIIARGRYLPPLDGPVEG